MAQYDGFVKSTDNSYDNISIGTQSDNVLDMPAERRLARARHAASFRRHFTREQIEHIKKLRADGVTYRAIGSLYHTSHGNIQKIISGVCYAEV